MRLRSSLPWAVRRGWTAAPLIAILLLTLGGCPLTSTSTGAGGSTGGPRWPGSGSSGGGSTTAGGTSGGGLAQTGELSGCSIPILQAQWAAEVLELLNEERTSRGLDPLTTNTTLEAQAGRYACELIHYDFFDHVNPVTGSTLRDRAEEFNYIFSVIGENLAAGQPTPLEAMTDWMNSEGHRANILDPRFTEVGIAVRTGGLYGTYWVQEFGRPR